MFSSIFIIFTPDKDLNLVVVSSDFEADYVQEMYIKE